MTEMWEIRIRDALDTHFAGLVLVLIVAMLVGGFFAVNAYTDPPTETVTEEESAWRSNGEFSHQATVINDSKPFEVGDVLRNQPVYFRSVSPRLNGSFAYSYTASDGGSVDTGIRMRLVVRSISEDERGNVTEYWRYAESLDGANATLAPGERISASFSRNTSALTQEIERVNQRLGDNPGTVNVTVQATVMLDGQRNGQEVDRRRTYRLPLVLEGGLVRVKDPGEMSHSGNTMAQRTRTLETGALWAVGGPLLLLVGLVGLGGLGAGRYYDWLEVDAAEREYLAYRRHRSEFDEWITEAELPTERLRSAETVITTTTLSGLVDLAIDTDRRVLESAAGDRFVVIDGDVVYTFEPPGVGNDGVLASGRSAGTYEALFGDEKDRSSDGDGTGDDDHGSEDAASGSESGESAATTDGED
jgi:hypothetical protein